MSNLTDLFPHDYSSIDYSGLPEHLREEVKAYIEQRRFLGCFLSAVFSNDLLDAVMRAEDLFDLKQILFWVYNNAPTGCWGSRESYEVWLKK
jgi:hypothetical protein